jgi:hypothetical protein
MNKYFFAKVGFSNCLLNYSIREAEHSNERKTFLWFGYRRYNNNETPSLQGNTFSLNKEPALSYRDLYYLTQASSSAFRETSWIITFNNDRMQVWRIMDGLRKIKDDELQLLLATPEIDGIEKSFKKGLGKDYLGLPTELNAKVLDVILEKQYVRDLLPACIDSLSVNQYLNRGTFRYVYRTNEGLIPPEILPGFFKLELLPQLIEQNIEEPQTETRFACFTRKYFDWLLSTSNESFHTTYNLKQAEINILASSIMSPSQLEHAAAMFLKALGLTLDVGIGKGLDEIDVRASIRHKQLHSSPEKYNLLKKKILNRLKKVMGSIDPLVVKFFEETGTLSIQCKNYDYSDNKDHSHLIVFKPTGGCDGKTITLESINEALKKDSEFLPEFKDWIELVQYSYTQPKDLLRLDSDQP